MKKSPKQFLPRIEIHYDVGLQKYWLRDTHGDWITINERSLNRQLRAQGFSEVAKRGLSPLDKEINRIQMVQSIVQAGPLAGYQAGVLKIGLGRFLVTKSPSLIAPSPGKFSLLESIFDQMFVNASVDQRPFFYGWLKIAVESLQAGKRRPGQMLVLAGPRNSAKSLTQNLITEMFGGRSAKPYRYMSGATQFNGDLFTAEHLMIEDNIASTDIRARRNFGAQIKEFTVNEVQSCQFKNRDAIHVRPFWRLTASINDEPENLLILPPIDDSIADKLMLLKVNRTVMPMPTVSVEEREAFWTALTAELPAFIDCLIGMDIPANLVSGRFGITHFHHPELLEALQILSPETNLLNLIDAVLWEKGVRLWTGSAQALEKLLMESRMGRQVDKVVTWQNATGTYLGRLAKQVPERVKKARTNSERDWIIYSASASETREVTR